MLALHQANCSKAVQICYNHFMNYHESGEYYLHCSIHSRINKQARGSSFPQRLGFGVQGLTFCVKEKQKQSPPKEQKFLEETG
jgi:hypothetical protein